MYERMTEDIKIRSKCQWYDWDEKSTKIVLKLEKTTIP